MMKSDTYLIPRTQEFFQGRIPRELDENCTPIVMTIVSCGILIALIGLTPLEENLNPLIFWYQPIVTPESQPKCGIH